MALKTIRMELARTKEQPGGDPGHAYEFRAPLDSHGNLDKAKWSEQKELCTVRRFENHQVTESGVLIRPSSGHWMFSYAPGDDDDEAIFRFSTHTFVPGEYVSVTEHDGVQRTFKVTQVTDWHPK